MFKKTIITSAVLAVAASSALAQDAQKLERIEITGSSIKRIDAETAVPLTVVTRESIDKSGASNVQELVDRLSSNNGGGRSLGQSIGDSNATGQSGASLRGLGRERTLVLLNGRRHFIRSQRQSHGILWNKNFHDCFSCNKASKRSGVTAAYCRWLISSAGPLAHKPRQYTERNATSAVSLPSVQPRCCSTCWRKAAAPRA